ncbi:MAG: paraquat-inducible protein A [Desulforegulaceae bacterium]|nr:paraquat-inducible protein A [Desulforegulaceae bacterium]
MISETSKTKKFSIPSENRVCLNCDLLQTVPRLNPGYNARCKRCASLLISRQSGALNKSLALTTASLILFFPAVIYPLITLKLFGETKAGSVLSGAVELLNSGYFFISSLVFIFAVFIPFVKLSTFFYSLLSVFLRKKLPYCFKSFKIYCQIKTFSMEEVFLMATLTALTKMDSIADYSIEPGFYFFICLIVLSVSAVSYITESEIWERLENI